MGKRNRHHVHLACLMLLAVAAIGGSCAADAQEAPVKLRGLDNEATGGMASEEKLDLPQILKDAQDSEGALFVQGDEVIVKPPLLKALIQLQADSSPYTIDASTEQPISLRKTLETALSNNLAIKISHSTKETSRWMYYSTLGNFLPTLVNGFTYQGLVGKYASPFGLLASVDNTNLVIPNTVNWTFFSGGSILYGARQAKHAYKASQFALKGATNDVLLEATRLYNQLLLNDVLLQIRIKAVETSKALLARNEELYANGVNTKLDVLQARTQLSRDRQALVSQQIQRRQAAVKLATALNMDAGIDLSADNRRVARVRLIDSRMKVGDLLQIAIDNRPELKKYENLRLAAKDAVRVAMAPLFPQVIGTATAATTGARVTGSSNAASQSNAAAAGLSVAGFSTSTAAATGGNSRGPSSFTLAEIFQLGLNVQWQLGGLGVTDTAKVQAARWTARRAQLEFSDQLARVYKDVRDAYLDVINADNLIKETTDAVNSSREQLEVATVRLEEGVGTDLDAVNAQRDYTQALIDKANAIINFNTAQASLLRATGLISLDTLTSDRPFAR